MLETLEKPTIVEPDYGEDEFEFHIEDDTRPGFGLCGEELDEDDISRPLVRGIYDCTECWRLHNENPGSDDDAEIRGVEIHHYIEDEIMDHDPLSAVKGIALGLAIGLAIWAVVYLIAMLFV